MKKILHHLGILVSLAAIIGFCLYAVRTMGSSDLSSLSSPKVMLAIAYASMTSALIIPNSAVAWRRMLASLEIHKPWSRLTVIMGITQLGKYLPGNVAQHIGRFSMSSKAGIPAAPFGITLLSESVLAILAAALVGVLACVPSGSAVLGALSLPHIEPNWSIPLVTVSIILLISLVLLSPRLIGAVAKRRFSDFQPVLPDTRALAFAFGCYVGNYLLLGTGLYALAWALLGEASPPILLLVGAFALSWIVGLLLPGAPAGLGVREAAMIGILNATHPGPDLILLVLALRVATTLGDLICFITASLASFAGRSKVSD